MADDEVNKAGSSSENLEIKFKTRKSKSLRKKKESSDEEETEKLEDGDEDVLSKLEDLRKVQKLRNRAHGVSLVGLAVGEKVSKIDELSVDDPFKVKSGGMVNMRALMSGQVKQTDDAYDVGIGTQFSAETNTRDEDGEMMKYIEEQLSKKKGSAAEGSGAGQNRYLSPEEAALLSVPEHLRVSSTQKSEEMLSNQMLSGIPEVDLGIDAKIRNIEATEEAKMKMLRERSSKKDLPSQFVPTNMAVNFVQHNRFNIEEPSTLAKRKQEPKQEIKKPFVVGMADESEGKGKRGRDGTDKATDDYHFEKFKKQFRRF
ncbi:splicing factor C9orf78 [Neocloeon triangulifer]|uniref:splicing factor C9orf78 n=1 Tax=Neocloeon triangulifer TaxID=2078957 RepID=UPI00286F7584|nr:splicing factor C9orf78 [Neocloeon triangulifer]